MDSPRPPDAALADSGAPAIRPMRPADIGDGLRLCRASGWNQVTRDWTQFLTLNPDGARVATLGDRVVGTVATIRYGARFGWIGMVLVDPAVRGRGIGTRLLDEGLGLLADLPLAGLDATPAGYGLYVKRGFREERRLRRLHATVLPDAVGPDPSPVLPMSEGDLAEVIALDEEVFGANRAPMLRWMWSGAREHAWIARENGRIAGYAFGRHGHLFAHIGPVVAEAGTIATQLTLASLRARAGRECIVDVAVDDRAWLRSLDALGFREQRPLIRMVRGAGALGGDPARQFAILGPEFG